MQGRKCECNCGLIVTGRPNKQFYNELHRWNKHNEKKNVIRKEKVKSRKENQVGLQVQSDHKFLKVYVTHEKLRGRNRSRSHLNPVKIKHIVEDVQESGFVK